MERNDNEQRLADDCLRYHDDRVQAAERHQRRNRLDLCSPSELKLYEAVDEIEKIGADVRLTDAIVKIQEARELVADFIDEEIKKK